MSEAVAVALDALQELSPQTLVDILTHRDPERRDAILRALVDAMMKREQIDMITFSMDGPLRGNFSVVHDQVDSDTHEFRVSEGDDI